MILGIDLHGAGLAAFVEEEAGVTAARCTARIVKTDGLPTATQLPWLLHQAFEGTRHAEWLESANHGNDMVIVSLPNSAAYRAAYYRALAGMGFPRGRFRFYSRAQMMARGIAAQHPRLVTDAANNEIGNVFAIVQPVYFGGEHTAEISVFDFSDDVVHQLGTMHVPSGADPSRVRAVLSQVHKFEPHATFSHVFYPQGFNQAILSVLCEHWGCPAIECHASPDDALPGLAHQAATLGGASGYSKLSLNCLGFSVWVDGTIDPGACFKRNDTLPVQGTFAAPPQSKLENGKLVVRVHDREGTHERLSIPYSGNETPLTLAVDAAGIPVLYGDGIPGGIYDILWNLNA